jgi:hypothetical protein
MSDDGEDLVGTQWAMRDGSYIVAIFTRCDYRGRRGLGCERRGEPYVLSVALARQAIKLGVWTPYDPRSAGE